ncbi:hypothetical protein ACX6XY_06365 [Streptomyces sp. O3]
MNPGTRLHASTRHHEQPTSDSITGGRRVSLALYAVDEHRADGDLALSCADAESLLASLLAVLGTTTRALQRRWRWRRRLALVLAADYGIDLDTRVLHSAGVA